MAAELKVYSMNEVARHNSHEDLWLVIDDKVFDLSSFTKAHPGGAGILGTVAGKDATAEFYELHRKEILNKYARLQIGTVAGRKPRSAEPTFSPIPYAECNYNQGWNSPYYTQDHIEFQKELREFVETKIKPKLSALEQSGRNPKKLYKVLGDAGLWGIRIGAGPHLKGYSCLGRPGESLDYFHEKIAHEEFARLGLPGAVDGIVAGNVIGTPPIIKHGHPSYKARVLDEIFTGRKSIVLAITEPYVGSDVANLRTTAKKTPCGKYYIVNGIKKWITNGTFADYYTTAVRTGGPGMKGVSMLLIPKGPGVTTKKMKTTYSPAAGTALVMYDNAKVPVENLLGQENQGFKVIVVNFNHERWMIVTQVLRLARLVIEECIRWGNQRKVFGKPLLAQPVIRGKIGNMVSDLESVQCWHDQITHQMCTMNQKQKTRYLAGPIALLKLQGTKVCERICSEAIQIFGGRAVTKNGMGGVVERVRAAAKIFSVYGGSEEIMADLGVKQMLKYVPKDAKL